MTEKAVGSYDRSTALIVVDVQNDFAAKDGALSVPGGEETIPQVNAEIAAAREAGALVAYTQDWHPPSTPHFEKDGGTWPVHCVEDTKGAEFHPDLEVVDAPVIRKGVDGGDGYSGFSVRDPQSGEESATELDRLLRDRGVERVVVVGLAQDYCVKETALDAAKHGYRTEVLTAGTRPVDMNPGDGDRALEEMKGTGVEVR